MEKKENILKYIEGKNFGKTIWSPVGRAMHKYNMIEDGDRIAVGVSGGKDSITTLNALVRIQKIANINFEIIPIHIHPNVDRSSFDVIKEYCEKLGLKLQVENTNLNDMLFGEKEVKNPCFLCGRIRRGILYRMMKEQNINKLALGHHKDDIIETFLMNVFYQGNMKMMKPCYESEDYGVKVIRPLAFVEEKDIIRYVNKLELPVIKSDCPYEISENSKRLRVKNLIKDLSKENKDVRSVIFNSISDLLK
ncbi:MAG: ATP-binding protein [Fusobacterium sp.]|nr:ATP-binding protein [Fusobacterium sp.]